MIIVIIGIAELTIFLPEQHSLKEKRSIIQSLLKRMGNKYNASVAEIGEQDKWQKSIIGVAVIGGTTAHAHSQLQSIIRFVEGEPRLELVEVVTEVI